MIKREDNLNESQYIYIIIDNKFTRIAGSVGEIIFYIIYYAIRTPILTEHNSLSSNMREIEQEAFQSLLSNMIKVSPLLYFQNKIKLNCFI